MFQATELQSNLIEAYFFGDKKDLFRTQDELKVVHHRQPIPCASNYPHLYTDTYIDCKVW